MTFPLIFYGVRGVLFLKGRPIQEKQFNRLVGNAKFYEQVIMTSFAVGFVAFIVFLMGFILN